MLEAWHPHLEPKQSCLSVDAKPAQHVCHSFAAFAKISPSPLASEALQVTCLGSPPEVMPLHNTGAMVKGPVSHLHTKVSGVTGKSDTAADSAPKVSEAVRCASQAPASGMTVQLPQLPASAPMTSPPEAAGDEASGAKRGRPPKGKTDKPQVCPLSSSMRLDASCCQGSGLLKKVLSAS